MDRPTLSDVTHNPDWIPHAFEGDEQLTSVFVPRAERRRLVFLTDGQFRDGYRKSNMPLASVSAGAAALAQAPLHFIFHTSFCCSTLLAKALDVEGRAASLSEPNILVSLAQRMIGTGASGNQARLELALRLLARAPEAGESVVVKPSSFANLLIEPILALRESSRAVLLYSDVETFLASVIRRGLLGRINARKLYANLAAWASLDHGFSDEEMFEQTDLQIAALAWLMHIAHFQEVADRWGPGRVRLLDAADLLAAPGSHLQQVQEFFRLGLSDEQVRQVVEGPAFTKHSKFSDVNYDSDTRDRDRKATMETHSEELAMVIQWSNAVAAHLGIRLPS